MMPRDLGIVFSLPVLLVLSLHAQGQGNSFIRGKVADINHEGIEYVNVVGYDTLFTEIIAFGSTDSIGNYLLEVPSGIAKAYFAFSAIGYTGDTILVDLNKRQGQNIPLIQLPEAAYSLEVVEIKDIRVPYTVKGDTSNYLAEYYSDGTENSVEELIRNIPGVKISPRGSIIYRGKPVSKVLLEKDELFGPKYTIGTQSMHPGIVDRIQFIDHYLENPLHEGIAESDDLVMNLELKEDRKAKIFGRAELGGGIPKKYDLTGNIFGLIGDTKWFIPVQLNNSGTALNASSIYSEDDFSSSQNTLNGRSAAYWANIRLFPDPNIPASLTKLDPIANVLAINGILAPFRKLRIKMHGLTQHERYGQEHSRLYRYIGTDDLMDFEERAPLLSRSFEKDMSVKIEADLTGDSNLNIHSSFGQTIGHNHSSLERSVSDISSALEQHTYNQASTHTHRLNYTYKLDDSRLLWLNAGILKDKKVQEFDFCDLHPDQILNSLRKMKQYLQHSISDMLVEAEIKGRNKWLSYTVGLRHLTQTDIIELNQFSHPLSSLGNVRDEWNYDKSYSSIRNRLKSELRNTAIEVALETGIFRSHTENSQSVASQENGWFVDHTLRIQSSIGPFWKWSNQYRLKTGAPIARDLLPFEIFTDYRSTFTGSTHQLFPMTHNFSTVVKYSNSSSLFEMTGFAMFSAANKSYGNQYSHDVFLQRSRRAVFGKATRLLLSLDIDKYIRAFRSNLSLSMNLLQSRSFVKNPGLNHISIQTLSLEPAFHSSWKTPMNMGFKLRFQDHRYLTKPQLLQYRHSDLRFTYSLIYRIRNRWISKIEIIHFFLPSRNTSGQHNFFGNFTTDYRVSSRMNMTFTIENLFGENRYSNESYDQISYQQQSFVLNGRYVLLQFALNF